MRTGRIMLGLLGALAAGASAAPSPQSGASGVSGIVNQAPGCPGPQRINHGECMMPVAGVNVELIDAAGKMVASAPTSQDGRYSIAAPAGKYRLHLAVEGVYPRCSDLRVTVRKNKMAVADLRCDSGMR